MLKYESTKHTLNDYLAKENIKYLICHIPKCYEHKIDEHGIMGGLIFKDRLLSMKDIPYYYSSDYSKPFNERYIRLMKDNALKVEKINPSFEFVTYKIRLSILGISKNIKICQIAVATIGYGSERMT